MLQNEVAMLANRSDQLDFRTCFIAGKACASGVELGFVLDVLLRARDMSEDVKAEVERLALQGLLFRAEQFMRQSMQEKALLPTVQGRISRRAIVRERPRLRSGNCQLPDLD
jgi:hypothetical protein